MTAARPGLLCSCLALRRSDENADAEHDYAAEHDLEHSLEEWRVHIARADIGDRPQFEEDDDAVDGGGNPERIGPAIGHQIRHGVTESAECRHQSAGQAAQPG